MKKILFALLLLASTSVFAFEPNRKGVIVLAESPTTVLIGLDMGSFDLKKGGPYKVPEGWHIKEHGVVGNGQSFTILLEKD